MHNWFQNLNDGKRKRHVAHFRGSFGPSWERQWLKYEVCTGPALRFEVSDDEGRLQLGLGLGFASLWLTFPWLKVPEHWEDRHWGFYVFEWTFRFFWGAHTMESSSKDPWYYNVSFNVLDVLLGQTVHFESKRLKSYGPRDFEFRGKRFTMDDIELKLGHWFRPRIPMALYCQKVMRMHLEIKNPPMRAGKGENSWDLDDDGSFGMTAPYDGPAPSWKNQEEVFAHCCLRYCESAAKDIKRYGRASGDSEPHDAFGFKYIGRKPSPEDPQAVGGDGA
jgi:hypothetical protein